MASSQPTVNDIRERLRANAPAPIYVLHGEEAYYTDELVKDFEALVPDDEKDFNLYILYATQVEPDVVVDACLRYPMMAERQVVILKEAQNCKADYLNRLVEYAKRPNPQTVLVIVGRGETLTGAAFMKAVASGGGVVFNSPRLWESQIGQKIEEIVAENGLKIDAKAKAMLLEHCGTSLSRIVNEIRKLTLVLPKNSFITPQVIEKLIGVSKDYNAFELVDALATRDAAKCYTIAEYFRSNPKNNSSIAANAQIFNFFANLLIAHYTPDKTNDGLAKALGMKPRSMPLGRVERAMRMFNARQVINAISACRRHDARSKGVGSRQDEYDLLRELIFTILN